jgi:hypothetical protein
MRTRIVIGAGAWLLGAAAATAGSLWVVSELGQGISGSPSQQSTPAALSQAQATNAAVQPSSPASPRSQRATAGTGGTGGVKSSGGTGGANSTAGTVLTSSGGTVVAQCASAGAFLLSWSPQQGFQASSVARGPASTARVVFTTAASTVTMAVTCSGGVPVATTTVTSAPAPAPSATGDDGGGNEGPGGGGGGGGGDG